MMDLSRRELSRLLGIGAAATLAGGATLVRAAESVTTPNTATENLPLDHVVWAVPDLEKGVEMITDLTGVEPVSGGRSPGRDRSHNALLTFGNGSYLEIIAPGNTGMVGGWADRVKDGEAHIVDYALRTTDRFAKLRAAIAASGFSATEPRPMGRVRPDGGALNWELLNVKGTPLDDALPFFIDWLGSAPHPSENSPGGLTLDSFSVAHPQAEELAKIFTSLGISTPVQRSNRHTINLTFTGPKGQVFLQ